MSRANETQKAFSSIITKASDAVDDNRVNEWLLFHFYFFLFPLLKPGPSLVVDLNLAELYLTAS